jgi:hypothetical protein
MAQPDLPKPEGNYGLTPHFQTNRLLRKSLQNLAQYFLAFLHRGPTLSRQNKPRQWTRRRPIPRSLPVIKMAAWPAPQKLIHVL